jgi:hypothetical protein
MVKLKRLITYTKGSRKKIRNQNNEDQIEKIIPLIWIEWWNWKRQKNLQKDQGKKLGSKEWRPQLKNIIFGKLQLKNEIENK